MEVVTNESGRTEMDALVMNAIRTVFDPEIPVNIVDLGLIYEVTINPDFTVYVRMTLTAPNCPAAGQLPGDVRNAILGVEDIVDANVEITFDPPYTMEMMSDEAKLDLGFL
ncbi:MAG: DUF59 domain-containing protein [Rhodothermales bacterium]|nr:DUF59 domain-containing protein [Rhodothermales bacterium]